MTSRKSILLVFALLILLNLPISGFATVHNITIGNNFFSPLGTIVVPGDTVRWTWAGGINHSATSDGSSPKAWDSGISSTGGNTFDLVISIPDGPGPFPYHCSVHFGMRDTIFVTAAPVEYNSIWEASSGQFPDSICPPWNETIITDIEQPIFVGDSLEISTSENPEFMFYNMLDSSLTIPDTFVFSFRMRLLGGSAITARAPASIFFTVSPGYANYLAINDGEIFIWDPYNVKGPSATVPTTDAMHDYTVIVYDSTSLDVFYDDSLVLSGPIATDSLFTTIKLTWGNNTSGGFGTSRWTYFKHNAYAFD